ncbi:hypothetical protein GGX14DRAFT_566750 [Mycena pura]|uniref:Zn(2)-C6 fungal-type domain-containing protein n=1 Tax=Mycena pura TaxID=153505 RepID=A0AAD6VJ57_9AGAR|nr:hypothetical protein GGX14DRAFT_566750 [Mycena pura]
MVASISRLARASKIDRRPRYAYGHAHLTPASTHTHTHFVEPTVTPLNETLPYYGLEPSLNMNLSFCDSDDELSALADELLDPEGGGTSESASSKASSPLHSLSAFPRYMPARTSCRGRRLRHRRSEGLGCGATIGTTLHSPVQAQANRSPPHSGLSPPPTQEHLPPPGPMPPRRCRRRHLREFSPARADRPRGRKPLACLFCRGRKIACRPPPDDGVTEARSRDGMKMCDQCSRRGRAICSYPVRSRRGLRSHTKRQLLHDMGRRE